MIPSTRATTRWSFLVVTWSALFALAYLDPARGAFAYMFAFVAWYSVYTGLLFWVMIVHACGASSMIVLRRFAERGIASGPALLVLLLPVLVSHEELFPWVSTPSLIPEAKRHLVAHKVSWLRWAPFSLRSLAYVLVPVFVGERLIALSRRQDEGKQTSGSMARSSIVGLIATALCLTFASFDWIMALDPVFYSNVLGVYLFAGGMCGALSIVTLGACTALRAPWTISGVSDAHVHALGKWLLSFVCFWAYIAFCQGMLIWIADLPEEVHFYIARTEHGWQGALLLLIVGHFFFPFFAILGKRPKISPRWLSTVCIWVLLMHFVDCHYLVVPSLRQHFTVSAGDVLSVLALGAASLEFCWLRSRSWRSRPEGDPLLPSSLTYRSLS